MSTGQQFRACLFAVENKRRHFLAEFLAHCSLVGVRKRKKKSTGKSRYHEAAKSTKGKGPGKAVTMRQPKTRVFAAFRQLGKTQDTERNEREKKKKK